MEVPFFNLSLQYEKLKPFLLQKMEEIMKGGHFIGGKSVDDLEEKLKRYYNWDYCVTVGNGTDGLILALKAMGIGKGDEVIVPAYSWISTAHAVSWTGAKPVFIDVKATDWTLDIDQIAQSITSKVKAWIPVHLLGQKIPQKILAETARQWKIATVEDAAQLHGIPWQSELMDTHVAVQSFYPTKQLGAYGDAGAVYTQNSNLALAIRKLANYGAIKHTAESEGVGINSRLDTLQAGILQVKMDHLANWIAQRKKIADYYHQALCLISEITLVDRMAQDSFYFYTIKTKKRQELIQFLQRKGIESRPFYTYTLPKSAPYFSPNKFPVAESIMEQALCLPLYPELTESQTEYVCTQIKKFYT